MMAPSVRSANYTRAHTGLIDHKAHIGAALSKLFEQYADNHFMTIYGEPTPQLIDLVRAQHMEKQIKWFSFVKGLDSTTK